MLIVLLTGSSRGVFRRRSERRSRPRRPRARLVTWHPGGLGSPSAPTTGSCLQWLHGWRRRGRKPLDRGSEELSAAHTEVRSRGQKNATDGAPRGARAFQKRARLDGKTRCATRCSVSLGFRGEKKM